MTSHGALFLNKKEWERINRKEHKNVKYGNEDYIKSLNERSRNWMKSWPDTVEGQVCLVEKQKRIQQSKNIAFVRNYLSKAENEREIHKESIKQARDLIFEDSCYGRKLLSALLESKTLEERNIQIEYQKNIKKENMIRQENLSLCNSIESADEMEKKETLIKLKQEEDNLRTIQINKLIIDKQKEDRKREEMENLQTISDLNIIKKTKAREEMEKENRKHDMKKDIAVFKMETERIKEKKKQQEIKTLYYIEKIRENQERMNCKIKMVKNEIIKEKNNKQSVFNQLKLLKEEEQSRYDAFIESGIRKKFPKQSEVSAKATLVRSEKLINHQFMKLPNTCSCDRQCIIPKCRKDITYKKKIIPETDRKTMTFYHTNKLVEEYKNRQQEPSPWSGLVAAHEQFAEHATDVIKECQYKNMAKKVIAEYRRTNCLDSTRLGKF